MEKGRAAERSSKRRMRFRGSSALSALSVTLLLAGCAVPARDGAPHASLMAGTSVVPKESVAAERCPELYRMREAGQGAFHRTIVC